MFLGNGGLAHSKHRGNFCTHFEQDDLRIAT